MLRVMIAILLMGVIFLTFAPLEAQNAIQINIIQRLGRGTIVYSEWSPNSQLIAATGSDGIWIYDADLKLISHLSERPANSLSWSHDSSMLASIYEDQLIVWNVSLNHEMLSVNIGQNSCPIRFSSDDSLLVVGQENGEIHVIDVQSGDTTLVYQEHIDEFRFETNGIQAIDRINDSQITSISSASNLHVWDVTQGERISTVHLDDFYLDDVCSSTIQFSPDHSKIFNSTLSIDKVAIWDTQSGSMLASYSHTWGLPETYSATWNDDSSQLAVITAQQEVNILDGETLEPIKSFYIYDLENNTQLDPSFKEAETHVDWNSSLLLISSVGDLRIVDVQTQAVIARVREHFGKVNALDWSNDGQYLISGHGDNLRGDNRFRIWDWQANQAIQSCETFTTWVRTVDWDAENQYAIISQGWWGSIRRWNTENCQLEAILSEGVEAPYGELNADKSVYAYLDGYLNFLSINLTEQEPTEYVGSTLSWSNTGEQLAIASTQLTILDALTKEILYQSEEFDSRILDMSWNSDDSLLALSISNGRLVIVNNTTYQEQVFELVDIELVTWHPHENLLAGTKTDGTVFIWDMSTKETMLETITDPQITDMVWSPDGKQLATAHSNGQIIIWQVAE